jgi:hypothetical protein
MVDWDPRLAPMPSWWRPFARLRRRRQCDIVPHFVSLLAAHPALEERWGNAPLLVRHAHLTWMAAAWRSGERRRRAALTLGYLATDRLSEAIQKLSWRDAVEQFIPFG